MSSYTDAADSAEEGEDGDDGEENYRNYDEDLTMMITTCTIVNESQMIVAC